MTSVRAIFCITLLIWLTSTPPLQAGEIRLPSLGGDPSDSILSPEQEQLLGDAFMRSLREQLTIIEQPEIEHYIQTMGRRLALQSSGGTRSFEFFVVDNRSINAFAGPAGVIGIHSGLIEMAESEGELAAVLAHEIAHVSQRHLMRRLESQQNLPIPAIATILATVVAASASPQAGEAVAATATGLSLQRQINFTRSNEREADRIGMQILHSAGYDPSNMPAFFRRLQQANRHSGESLPEYLRTHPLTLSRVADAESRAAQFPPQQELDSGEFFLIRQILHINRMRNPELTIRNYRTQLEENRNPATQERLQFGYGLALLKADLPKQALRELLPLQQRHPDQPTLAIATARARAATGAMDEALYLVQQLHNLYPSHLPLILSHADLLLQNGQPGAAAHLLEQGIATLPDSPELYKKQATAYAMANHQARSHLAQAHYHFLMTETKSALSQLDYAERAARENRSNFIIFSTIDARRLSYEKMEEREKAL